MAEGFCVGLFYFFLQPQTITLKLKLLFLLSTGNNMFTRQNSDGPACKGEDRFLGCGVFSTKNLGSKKSRPQRGGDVIEPFLCASAPCRMIFLRVTWGDMYNLHPSLVQ